MLVGLLAARSKTLKRLKEENPQEDEKMLASRLIAYSSGLEFGGFSDCLLVFLLLFDILDQSHSAAERAGLLAGVHVRVIATDDQYHLRANAIKLAVDEDRKNGKIPFMVKLNQFEVTS